MKTNVLDQAKKPEPWAPTLVKRQRFEISFYCRPSKVNKAGESPIEMSIILNGNRTYVALPRRIKPREFDVLTASKKQNELKEYLDIQKNNIYQIQSQIIQSGRELSIDLIKAIYLGTDDDSRVMGIYDVWDEYLTHIGKGIGINITERHHYKCNRVLLLFKEFYTSNDDINKINTGVIQGFIQFLQVYKQLTDTTISGMLTKCKSVFIYALNNGYITRNPFGSIKISKKQKDVEYLTEVELNKIINKNLKGLASHYRVLEESV